MLERGKAPNTHKINSLHLPEPDKLFLDNGVEVALFKLGSQNVVHVEFVFKTGMSNADNLVIPAAASELIGTSSKKYSSGEIAEKIDYYGAFIDSNINMEILTFSVFSLTKYIDKVLLIFQDALMNVVYESRDLETHLKNASQHLKTDLDKVEYICSKEFNRQLFEEHPYAKNIEIADFENIKTKDLQNYFNDFIGPNLLKIVVSGNFELKLFNVLNKCFGKWNGDATTNQLDRLIYSEPKKVFIKKDNASQSAIRIGKIIDVEFGSEDYFILKILNTILGGYFGSRLMSNIREDKGFTYGINSSIISYKHAIFIIISTEVKAEVTVSALKEIYKEISILKKDLILEKELVKVKSYISGSLLRMIDGPFLIAEQYKLLNLKGYELKFLLKFYNSIQKVTADQLLECANKYLDKKSLSEVVVGKLDNN